MSWKSFFKHENKTEFSWNELTDSNQLETIIEASNQKPQLIFKHSTRCSISSMAKARLEREWNANEKVVPWHLDLIAFRSVSNEIAERFSVEHQSPQAILVKDGKVVYHSSHSEISAQEIQE